MKNILNERPQLDFESLHGLPRYICESVKPEDVKNQSLLEIGVGYGWFLKFCLEKEPKYLLGIEYDNESILTAQDTLNGLSIDLKVANALDLSFNEKIFDTVACFEVLEHLPKNKEARLFQEVHRVLKPGGAFYLSTPYLSFLSTVLDPAWWLIGHRHYSKKKMHELASSTGFKIEDLQIRGGNWMMLFTHNLYISKWIFRRPVFFKEFFDRKMDEEFKENGYGNLILRMRKS